MYWKIIKNVHTKCKGIVQSLAELTETSEEWWNSHGRAPSTFNQQNSGKKWQPVEGWLEAVDLYEEAHRGAGVMLSEEINQHIRHKYTDFEIEIDQRDLVNKIIVESSEAATEVNKKDLNEMDILELETARGEIVQAIQANQSALDVIDGIIKKKNVREDYRQRVSLDYKKPQIENHRPR